MEDIIRGIAAPLGLHLQSFSRVSGGDINEAFQLRCQEGHFFLKANQLPQGNEMLLAEVEGLRSLAAAKANCPEIIAQGTHTTWSYLLLSYHAAQAPQPAFWTSFGAQLAALHQATAARHGWPTSNFIGSLPQQNAWQLDWPTFYRQQRLQPQIELAVANGLLSNKEETLCQQFLEKIPELLPNEAPRLLHGDLWSGNFICASDTALFIDPACSYGHREMDLAMSKLFGGFDAPFYEVYAHHFPLLTGHEERVGLYQLYYLFVHLNLFGRSYWGQIEQIMVSFR